MRLQKKIKKTGILLTGFFVKIVGDCCARRLFIFVQHSGLVWFTKGIIRQSGNGRMRFYKVVYNAFEGQKSSIIITWYNSKVKLKLFSSM